MNRILHARRRPHSGMALVAVLWMVAALAILSAGLANVSRGELRSALNTSSHVEASALGDAAIQLLVLEMRSISDLPEGLFSRMFDFDGRVVTVEVVPASGLIDLNNAPEPLLRDLFVFGAGRDPSDAEVIARRIVEWRAGGEGVNAGEYEAAGQPGPRAGPFQYPEDLMQVLGVDYDDYANIARLVTVSGNSPGVDPLSAPQGVLAVLAAGDAGLSERISAARDEGDPTLDLTGLTQDHIGPRRTEVLRMDAYTELGGRILRHTRWVDLGRPSASGALWRSVRVEPVTGLPSATNSEHGI